jgi:hypothetical protein
MAAASNAQAFVPFELTRMLIRSADFSLDALTCPAALL